MTDLIFECRKCLHQLYVEPSKVRLLLVARCPTCGRDPIGNWFIAGEGVFEDGDDV